jgi:hypothetical protein
MNAVDMAETDERWVELPTLQPAAPAALDSLNAARATLAHLEAKTGRKTLDRNQGQPGAAAALRDHLAEIEKAKAEVDLAEASHGEALEQDGADRQRLVAAIRDLDPDDAVDGITAQECCALCGGENGCMIAGGINACMHPRKGGVPPAYHNDRLVQRFRQAAEAEINRQAHEDEENEE